jgi:hypothetical protein
MRRLCASLDGALVLGLSDEIEREASHHGHVVHAVPDPEVRPASAAERQTERYAREGIDLSLSALADQVGACAI